LTSNSSILTPPEAVRKDISDFYRDSLNWRKELFPPMWISLVHSAHDIVPSFQELV
jgi:hypothetical protein